jgi:Fur family ferric uptake transcriptional regulator
MITLDTLVNNLANAGIRKTRLSILLLKTLLNSAEPLSAENLIEIAAKNKLKVNKTSVYRQLLTMKNEQIIREVRLDENKKRYEIFPENHHHHFVCVNCRRIEDVEAEKDLVNLERKITQERNFKVENHSLEFFGLCANCNH